jgi:hypothetical protein
MLQNYNHFITSKWTLFDGEKVEKSSRKQGNAEYHQQQYQEHYQEQDNPQHMMFETSTGLNDLGNGFTRQTNKRDSFNEMLSHRDLHTQVGQNPFLAGESYLQHIKVQEDFLRPQNTNIIEPNTNS